MTTTPKSDYARASGWWHEDWDAIAGFDAEWMERFLDMGMHPLIKGVLEPKVVQFLAIALDASCTHMYAPGVRRHIAKALDLGATPEEIMAVLQCTSVLGIHSASMGAPILLEEMTARGIAPPAAKEA